MQFFRDAPQVPAVIRHPSDDQVIACAAAARAEYLVTGDYDMLVLSEHQGIRLSRRGGLSIFSMLRAPVGNGR